MQPFPEVFVLGLYGEGVALGVGEFRGEPRHLGLKALTRSLTMHLRLRVRVLCARV